MRDEKIYLQKDIFHTKGMRGHWSGKGGCLKESIVDKLKHGNPTPTKTLDWMETEQTRKGEQGKETLLNQGFLLNTFHRGENRETHLNVGSRLNERPSGEESRKKGFKL